MVWRSQQALLSPAPQAALYIRCLSFHRHLPSLRFRRPAQCIQGRRRPRSPRSCVLAGCEHTGQADDGGIIIAKGARALFRMTETPKILCFRGALCTVMLHAAGIECALCCAYPAYVLKHLSQRRRRKLLGMRALLAKTHQNLPPKRCFKLKDSPPFGLFSRVLS